MDCGAIGQLLPACIEDWRISRVDLQSNVQERRRGIHAEVLDFPSAISFGTSLDEARRMLASAGGGYGRDEPFAWIVTSPAGPHEHQPRGRLGRANSPAFDRSVASRARAAGNGAVKRRDLLRHLRSNGCQFVREGGEHSIWENPANGLRTAVPRHRDIPDYTVQRESASSLEFRILPDRRWRQPNIGASSNGCTGHTSKQTSALAPRIPPRRRQRLRGLGPLCGSLAEEGLGGAAPQTSVRPDAMADSRSAIALAPLVGASPTFRPRPRASSGCS